MRVWYSLFLLITLSDRYICLPNKYCQVEYGYKMEVCHLCILALYTISVFYLCILSVFYLCILSLYFISVFYLCILSLYSPTIGEDFLSDLDLATVQCIVGGAQTKSVSRAMGVGSVEKLTLHSSNQDIHRIRIIAEVYS